MMKLVKIKLQDTLYLWAPPKNLGGGDGVLEKHPHNHIFCKICRNN